jgi:serine/threonine-protein phosphatase 2A regulatory subunit B'
LPGLNAPLTFEPVLYSYQALFSQKLDLCSVIFNFDDPNSDKRGKDLKRQTLLELVDYVNNAGGQKIFNEHLMPNIMTCVSANICRALPPQTEDFDPEEDEPVLEPSWPHLQVMYEFFLRFVVSSEVNAKVAKKHVDQTFCLKLVELFDSEDPRERDYLKTILHRIYGKFMSHRSFIRKTIQHVFYRFIFETERHNGIAELLEILGSIINGFAMPLKREHVNFLQKALVPLHKPKCVGLYHQQLSYCITQYVEKDPATALCIVNGLIKYWPWGSSAKVGKRLLVWLVLVWLLWLTVFFLFAVLFACCAVLYLNELEEIMELMGPEELTELKDNLFPCIAKCLGSEHFQVAERTLFLWNNEHLVNVSCILCNQPCGLELTVVVSRLDASAVALRRTCCPSSTALCTRTRSGTGTAPWKVWRRTC